MSSQSHRLQYAYLNQLRRTRTGVTIFLVNGVKLSGVITWYDLYTILLKRHDETQLVYKHAISTIMPTQKFVLEHQPSEDDPHLDDPHGPESG